MCQKCWNNGRITRNVPHLMFNKSLWVILVYLCFKDLLWWRNAWLSLFSIFCRIFHMSLLLSLSKLYHFPSSRAHWYITYTLLHFEEYIYIMVMDLLFCSIFLVCLFVTHTLLHMDHADVYVLCKLVDMELRKSKLVMLHGEPDESLMVEPLALL